VTTAGAQAGRTEPSELARAFAAARFRPSLVALLLALTGVAWVWTAHAMAGMNAGPMVDLGGLGWFVGVWVVMMAAMMLPALVPTVALYARMSRPAGGGLDRSLLFCGGYLAVWGLAGLAAYGLAAVARTDVVGGVSWAASGHWITAVILAAAAGYQLTPMKDVCLGKCRSPLGFLLGTWRGGRRGAIEMGSRHAAWCVGCCWALMAALFALGVMSLTWMALVSAVIVVEKTLPWRRAATLTSAAILLALALVIAVAPAHVPGLVTPGHMAMGGAGAMGDTMH
jgi:predicted metal-binding membrane protein